MKESAGTVAGKWRVVKGSVVATIGYILSPLSWWNDPFVNIPLAYVGAWIVSQFYPSAFGTAFIGAYWLTNIAGFFLMHKGVCQMASGQCSNREYLRKGLLRDLLTALAYTAVIIVLLRLDILQPISPPSWAAGR